jgi:arylsulfatase
MPGEEASADRLSSAPSPSSLSTTSTPAIGHRKQNSRYSRLMLWLLVGVAVILSLWKSLSATTASRPTSMTYYQQVYSDVFDVRPDGENENENSTENPQDQRRQEKEQHDSRNHHTTHNNKMNIVFFYADDWTMQTLGVLNEHVKTPYLDWLSRRGILFKRNSVTTSICWQSRATMMTSLYTSKHQQLKIWDMNMFNVSVPWADTLYPQLKSRAGYHVGYVGKWHAPFPSDYLQQSMDYFVEYYGDHWLTRGGRRRHVTELNAADALAYLRHGPNNSQPLALTVAFFATHADDSMPYPLQYNPMAWSARLYNDSSSSKIPLPKTATPQHWQNMPWFFTESNEGRIRWRQRYDTSSHYQTSMHRYYRMASEVDAAIGAVLRELRTQNILHNTYILFSTDNGNFHGEHGLADKWYPHQESIQVPLIIVDPRMPRDHRGTINDELTLNLDLAPTLLSAAGIQTLPAHMQGRDIADLYLHTDRLVDKPWRQDFFYEWSQGRPEDAQGHGWYEHIPAVFALVSKTFKYFYWPQTQYEQVFHIGEDPYEEHDLRNVTTVEQLEELKQRYAILKNLSQQGYPV